jgi:serine/threonine-protein kinase
LVSDSPSSPIDRVRAALADHYVIGRELGHGAMATVYLARDVKHDRDVAVKVMRPELVAVLGATRFLQEIRFAAHLQHPHIVPLFDSGAVGDVLYYVMPYVEGESLRRRLERETQLPLDDAIAITTAVAGALDYAHRQNIVHRDIKPENILLHDGHPLVADFGVALAVSTAGGTRLTGTGVSLGTPAYMSPEQAAAEPTLDGRSDQYSLACVCYEMLSGEPVYSGSTAQSVIAKHLSGAIPHLSTVRNVPGSVDRAVTRALAKAPADRFPTARAFADALTEPAHPRGRASGARRRPAVVAAVVAVLLVAIALGGAEVWVRTHRGAPASGGIRSIAVLPLENVGGDPRDEYFSDGMTDELMAALSRVPGLRVASRTSSYVFKGKRNVDVRQIANRLNVAAVLEGSVQRDGSRMRINTQLTNVSDGLSLWSERYERTNKDVFQVEDEISQAAVRALTPTLTGRAVAHLARPGTDNIEAYDLYLRARYRFNNFTETDLRESIKLYQQALDKDPRYALAWAGIAESWSYLADDYVAPREAEPNVKAAALHALSLDSSVAAAHALLGTELYQFEWNFDAGGRELRQALALDPHLFISQLSYHGFLIATGHLDSALAVLEGAQALDPLSVLDALFLGRFYGIVGRYDRAAAEYRHALDLTPGNPPALLGLGQALLDKGDTAAADSVLRVARSLFPPEAVYVFAESDAGLGRRAEAARLVADMVEASKSRYIGAEGIAAVYVRLGDANSAFRWLDSAVVARSAYVLSLKADRKWDPIRADPRFAALVQRIGLP